MKPKRLPLLTQYMRRVALHYVDHTIDDDKNRERMDRIWARMKQADRDEANRLVVMIFNDHM
jgi:hypothetical protein